MNRVTPQQLKLPFLCSSVLPLPLNRRSWSIRLLALFGRECLLLPILGVRDSTISRRHVLGGKSATWLTRENRHPPALGKSAGATVGGCSILWMVHRSRRASRLTRGES